MFRRLITALAALAAGACSYGSAVDVAPFKDRIRHPMIATGEYCEVRALAGGGYEVNSAEDCVGLQWRPELRGYRVLDLDPDSDKSEDVDAAIVSLGGGLYAAQTSTPDAKTPYELQLVVAAGDAFATFRILDDDELKAISPRHPKLTFGSDNGRPYVAAGKVSDVKDWLRDIAHVALSTRSRHAEPDEENGDVSIGVLDRQGNPVHAATPKQVRGIKKVKHSIEAIVRR